MATPTGTANNDFELKGGESKPHRDGSAVLGDMVQILMRSPRYKHFSIADLEWLVLPALAHGQFAIGYGRTVEKGHRVLAGLVLWAMLSEERAEELRNNQKSARRLRPDESKSGTKLSVFNADGFSEVVKRIVVRLRRSDRPIADITECFSDEPDEEFSSLYSWVFDPIHNTDENHEFRFRPTQRLGYLCPLVDAGLNLPNNK